MTTWIVAADEYRARIFEVKNAQEPFEEIADLVNPEARMREQDMNTDAQGHYLGSGERSIGHNAEPNVSASEHTSDMFSRSVSDYLEKARAERRYDALTLIVFPKFLGLLRKNLSKEVQQLVTEEVPKDISWLEPRQIEEYVNTHLR